MRYQISNYALLLKMLEIDLEGDQCLVWPRGLSVSGYGQLRIGGAMGLAHRASYELKVGPIPEGYGVLHKCDNPPCFRPSHLFAGTSLENTRDCMAKGRFAPARGENSGAALLTEELVVEIRGLSSQGYSHSAIAKRFGIGRSTVGSAVIGLTWAHIPGAARHEDRRHPNGSTHAKAKLTEAQVLEIRSRCAAGENQRTMAQEYGVSFGLIGHVHRRRAWKYLE